MAGLSGRVGKLERAGGSPEAGACRGCGLRHDRPLTLALIRSILRIRGGAAGGRGPAPRLCLCDCCGDERSLAELTHR